MKLSMFVHDYRALDAITVKNCYLIPSKVSIFTKIDLRWRYSNICIKEENKWKIAFITR